MNTKTKSIIQREALSAAFALIDACGMTIESMRPQRVTWAKFTGIAPQEGYRIKLRDKRNRAVLVTARKPRGGLLCDFSVPHSGRQWTQLANDGDRIMTRWAVRDVRSALLAPAKVRT